MQILSSITDLAVSARRPPQDLVLPFFAKVSAPPHSTAFDKEVAAFVGRVQARAIVKKQEQAEAEAQEEELEELRPGDEGAVSVTLFSYLQSRV